MKIDIEFMVPPRFLEGINEEIKVRFENVPYVPAENLSLWVKWEDFYDEKTAGIIYRALRDNFLSARKILERFEKDRVFVQFDYLPFMPEGDINCDCEECNPHFPNLN
ncbi:hypothetical protein [Bergeyella zoohelcum]|uniref:Uncharacterized protein n=1 Tax=Bergeyella zoohelcum TaxID=1015 RepID=A0A380ZUZ2_9FLAO|nr:hypothetical protein [Bergeyella zoohelcum]EKB58392.1 hypothetical protein HMPREF9700_01844 [Bergeyella zoohelcum CCUG 30536]SUV53147.1 Uncharacterised protein [Bergeyella zoohelcum]